MFLFLSCIFGVFSAQALVTSDQVLKTAWSDQTYLVHDEIQSTDSKNPFRTVEAFASTEDNGKNEVEVGLKFQLKSWPEWSSGRSRGQQQRIQKESALAWALRDRYGMLLNYQINLQKLQLLKNAQASSEAYVQAQSLSLKAGRSTQKSFLNAQGDQYKLKRLENAVELEQELLKNRLQRWVGGQGNVELEMFDLLGVDDVYAAVKSSSDEGSLTARLAKEELINIGQELEIVRGRENQWFKGFEIAQTQKSDERKFEFEVTFQLPILASDDWAKEKQNELILKKSLKQREIENTGDRLKILRLQILNLVEMYRIEKKKRGQTVRGADPLVNLEAKLMDQEEQLELLNQRQEVTLLYLDYLLESEILLKDPQKHYLVASQKALQ
jgi:hypothetical protein